MPSSKPARRSQARRGDYPTLSIPKALYQRANELIQGTGFRSVTEYVVLLRESVTMKRGDSVKERLKALGYID